MMANISRGYYKSLSDLLRLFFTFIMLIILLALFNVPSTAL
jgi:hypothetical protein